MQVFSTYILRSKKDGKHYYGSTLDLEERISHHNSGKVKSTKSRRPFEMIYYQECSTRSEAIKRERFFKSIDGYNWLKSKGII